MLFVLLIIVTLQLPRALKARLETTSISASAAVPAVSVAETGYQGAGLAAPAVENSIAAYPGLTDFAAVLVNGHANEVVGVYVPGSFALRVEQQPAGQPDYVNRENNMATQFSLPSKYGSIGLLAHNYLSGSNFFRLALGQDVVLVYGDGRLEHYQVNGSLSFRALKPNSPFSEFVDLSDPNSSLLTSADLFDRVYTTGDTLVFQTCIDAEGDPSWGRIFVTAQRAEPLQLGVPAFTPLTSAN
jgi:hypothetical protein